MALQPQAVFSGDRASDRYGGLRSYLFALTGLTGIVDAISYLSLGHVFVANMTGNVVFVGFAAVAPAQFSVPASLAALAAFVLGGFVGGWVGTVARAHAARLLLAATLIELALLLAALLVALEAGASNPAPRYALIGLLAVTMGLQNGAVRRAGVPDITTTVLTSTLTALATDSRLTGGPGAHVLTRLGSIVFMVLGAAAGALLLDVAGVTATLAVCVVLLTIIAALLSRHWNWPEPVARVP